MKRFTFSLLLVFTCFFIKPVAAQVTETITPYFEYGSGVKLLNPDSLFLMNIRFRMQNRAAFYTESGSDLRIDEIEARVRRLRLRFNGFLYRPELTYVIQLSFSRGDLDINEDGVPNIIRDAMVVYSFNRHFRLGLGQTKLPGNRQRVISSGDLQLPDRSIVNAIFNIDRDFGLQAYYNNNFNNFHYVIRAAISSGEGRNSLSGDNGLAYTGRLELLPFGEFTAGGDYFEGDLAREQSPKISSGFSYSFNESAVRSRGQLGNFLFEPRNLSTVMADFLLKYQGFAYSYEYIQRSSPDPVTRRNEEERYIFVGHGHNHQSSYIFPNNFEIVGRFSHVIPHGVIRQFEREFNQYTLGMSKYVKGHRVKFQTDLTYDQRISYQENENNLNHWQMRFQVELGI